MAVVSGAGADPTASVEVGVDEDTAFYWEAASQGLLMAQRCATCARLWHPPSPVCPHCQGLDWTLCSVPVPGSASTVQSRPWQCGHTGEGGCHRRAHVAQRWAMRSPWEAASQ